MQLSVGNIFGIKVLDVLVTLESLVKEMIVQLLGGGAAEMLIPKNIF